MTTSTGVLFTVTGPTEQVTAQRNNVVVRSAPEVYVSEIAPPMGSHVPPASVLCSHWKDTPGPATLFCKLTVVVAPGQALDTVVSVLPGAGAEQAITGGVKVYARPDPGQKSVAAGLLELAVCVAWTFR